MRVVKQWKIGKVAVGIIRNGVYRIDRTVDGQRYRCSTGKRTPEAAAEELARFERDPEGYVARPVEALGWDGAAVDFVAYSAQTKGNSPKWVREQSRYLAEMWEFRVKGRQPFARLDSWRVGDVDALLASIKARGCTSATKNRCLATLKGFMRWARERSLTTHAADVGIKLVRENRQSEIPKAVPEPVWRAVLDRLFLPAGETPFVPPPGTPPFAPGAICPVDGCGRAVHWRGHCSVHARQLAAGLPFRPPRPLRLPVDAGDAGERWRCAAMVQLGAGLRYGEVARLRADDVHAGREGGALHIPIAKGGVGRLVSPVSAACVAAALRLVELGGVPDDGAIAMDRRLYAAARRAGVAAFSSHQLRHTHATANLRGGMDLRTLQARLGHASITTTEKYLHAARPAQAANTSPL